MDRAPAHRALSRESDGVPRRDGRARALRQAVPRLRCASAAHCVRGERNELLRSLPDRRAHPGRPRALTPAQEELAALDRRTTVNCGYLRMLGFDTAG